MKKILSLLIAVAMLFSLGVTAMAEETAVAKIGETPYATLQAAIDAATEGATITLLSDITVESDLSNAAKGYFNIAADDVITIDLNGKTINATDNSNGNFILFYNYGDLTIKNGTVNLTATKDRDWNAQSTVILNRGGNLTVDSGTYKHNGGTDMAITIDDSGNSFGDAYMTVNGGTIDSTYIAIRMRMGDTNLNGNPGNGEVYLTVNGGTISGTKRGVWGQITNAYAGPLGGLTVTGGTISGSTDAAIRMDEDTYNNIDVSISGTAKIDGAIAGDNVDYTVTGGMFTAAPQTIEDGYAAIKNLDGAYIVGEKPTATVNNLGAMTLPAGGYGVWDGKNYTSKGNEELPLSFVMQFIADQNAEDMKTSPYADWYADFVITFDGLKTDSFVADGCYLAGYYGDFGWVKVPVDSMKIEKGARYPVMLGVGLGQKYDYICSGVKDFKCALYLTPEILKDNPNLKVNLELTLVDNSKGENAAASAIVNNENVYKVTDYNYTAEDFVVEELFDINSMNLDLENSLKANFYVLSSALEGTDYYAKIIHSSANGDVERIVNYAEWVTKGDYKMFSYTDLVAKNMADTITVAIYNGDGTPASNSRVTSIKGYAENYIENNAESNDEKTAAWVTAFVDMLNYGAEAQKHFNYSANNLANASISDYQKYATVNDVELKKDAVVSGAVYGANLDLEEKIVYNGYFSNVTDDMYAKVSFTNHLDKKIEYDAKLEKNKGYHQVSVDKLVIADANQPVTITVYTKDGNVHASLTESINGYLFRTISAQPEFAPLARAMAKFTASANTALHTK